MLPNRLPRPADELEKLRAAWRTPRGWRVLSTVNNTNIGLAYIATALLFFVLAGVLALLMRAQLAVPENTLLSPRLYNQVFTMHGTVMMFLFAVPIVEAVAASAAAADARRARPAVSAAVGLCLLGLSARRPRVLLHDLLRRGARRRLVHVSAADQRAPTRPGIGADFWLLGIGFIEISAIAGAIETHRRHPAHARAGHDARPDADLRLGHAGLRRA